MKVTVLTPTYNRAHTLKKLYDSLVNQTSEDFSWLIIDDGSSDGTYDLIQEFIKERKIDIRYISQKNGGKHRALNTGIKEIDTELTIIVDSDDWLKENAVETILKYADKYKDKKTIAALSFLRSYTDGNINGPKYKKDEFIGDYIESRLNGENGGDKMEVCFTDKLKEFPFLEIPGEKFLSEGYLWIKMALKYKTVYINKIITIGDYLQDGLTKNIYKVRVKNPLGCVEVARLGCNDRIKLKIKIKNMMKYITYSIFAKIGFKEQYKKIDKKILYIVCFIPGIMFYYYVRNKVK